MLRKLVCLVVFVGMIMGFSVCSAIAPEDARLALFQAKVNYDTNTFLTKIQQKDDFSVKLFIISGFDLNSVTPMGNTPLKFAIVNNSKSIVDMLLETGKVNLDWKDNSGRTVLDVAEMLGYTDIATDLKEHGAKGSETYNHPVMTDKETAAGVALGKKLLQEKTDFVFESSDTDKTRGGFLGADIKSMGRAYWMTPFCNVATEELTQSKAQKPDDTRIQFASNTYQARVMFSFFGNNIQELSGLKFVVTQNNKEIPLMYLVPTKTQITNETVLFGVNTYARIGFMLYIYGGDITPGVPVKIKAVSAATKELTFSFSNSNEPDKYSTKEDVFKWVTE